MFDDLFVQGAAYVEPSASDRARDARRRRRKARPPSRPAVHRVLGFGLIGVLGIASVTLDRGPAVPDRLVLVVATTDGQDVDADAVVHEALLAEHWLEAQTGGQLRGGLDRVTRVRLDASPSELVGSSSAVFSTVLEEVSAAIDLGRDVPVVVTPLTTETRDRGSRTCGLGGPHGIMLFMGNCGAVPSTSSTFGSPVSRTIAHELVHALGAVADCAPHATSSGHVDDDPSDLMYEGPLPWAGGLPTLDLGADDYFGHDDPNCPDLLDSPLWEG